MSEEEEFVPVAVAEVVASLQPSISTSNVVSDGAVRLLQSQGYPVGLASELGNSKAMYPLRFWIVDNSGSMVTADGRELTGGSNNNLKVSACTRWQELQRTVEYHIALANLIGVHTIFRFLNPPGENIPQEFCIAEHGVPSGDSTVNAALQIVRNTVPAGVTPLTIHLRTITARVKEMAPLLRQQSQKAVVVVATDGLPTDPGGNRDEQIRAEFIAALKTLQLQPVWIVIRLCTENDEVVDFYNDLDKELEFPLEVIDDFVGEATEVSQVNKWLNYTLPLHRCREMGYHHRVFDLLDEGGFNHDQLRQFVKLIFGRDFADPLVDWKEFIAQIDEVNETVGKEWNCKTKKLSPWIDKRELTRKFSPKRGIFGSFKG